MGGSLKMMCVCVMCDVCVFVCLCVRSITDQVLNGKTLLSKVSSSKRDPKRGTGDVLVARFQMSRHPMWKDCQNQITRRSVTYVTFRP